MGPAVGLLQLSLLAVVVLTALGSVVSGGLYLALRSCLARWAPAPRAAALLFWTTTPALLGLSLTGLCFIPSLLAILGRSAGDHCVGHPDHHVHLCLLHPPHDAGATLGWTLLAATVSLAAVAVGRHLSLLRRAHRGLSQLHADAGPDRTRVVAWVPSPAPLALTVGMLKPRVVVSDGLRDRLAPSLLGAVLEHEAAHQRRGDVLRKAVAGAFALLHWPSVGKRLLDDLHLACEQAADAEAAEKLGSPLVVADAILAVERLTATHSYDGFSTAASFGGPYVTARVEELLHPRAPVAAFRPRRWVAVVASVGLLFADPVHHIVEMLLTPLAR